VRRRSLQLPSAQRALSLCGAALAVVLPLAAWACPSCASKPVAGLSTIYFAFAMMLLPFGIAGVVVKVIQTLPDETPESQTPQNVSPESAASAGSTQMESSR
jgi:hypothetical protein